VTPATKSKNKSASSSTLCSIQQNPAAIPKHLHPRPQTPSRSQHPKTAANLRPGTPSNHSALPLHPHNPSIHPIPVHKQPHLQPANLHPRHPVNHLPHNPSLLLKARRSENPRGSDRVLRARPARPQCQLNLEVNCIGNAAIRGSGRFVGCWPIIMRGIRGRGRGRR
jgi:hypothetical protein